MIRAERHAQVKWKGNLTRGDGKVTFGSGSLPEVGVSWAARTEEPGGKTSPEELVAAAHASCFAMALSNELDQRGMAPDHLTISATAVFEVDQGPVFTSMALDIRGQVPGISPQDFQSAVDAAGQGCPVSNALRGNVDITVTAELA